MNRISGYSADAASMKRTPQQERGGKRVRQILNAAASIITEQGSGKLTIQNLSKAAKTSPGSLYHFFPDLDAVISTLSERHKESIGILIGKLEKNVTLEQWQQGSVSDFIHHLFSPYAQYLLDHRDYLPVRQLRGFAFGESGYLEFMQKVMTVRYPGWAQDKVISESLFLHAIAIGTIQQIFLRDKLMAYTFIPKILSVLELYLTYLEQDISLKHQ